MNMRIKEERYHAAKTDLKALEQTLKRTNSEATPYKQVFEQTEAEERRKAENIEAKAKKRDSELDRMRALIDEKDNQHAEAIKKLEEKLSKREARAEQ